MANYKDIKGTNVQDREGNPDNPVHGQLWYNSATRVLKGRIFVPDAFSTGGNLPTSVRQNVGAGTQTAGLSSIGYSDATSGYLSATNEYNGTSWTGGGTNPATARNAQGAGTQTAALSIGGIAASKPSVGTEEYDASSWTAGGNLGSGGYDIGTTGPQTAALAFGRYLSDTAYDETQHYDGTSWSTPPATLSTARRGPGNAAGTQTAGLASGGGLSDATQFTAVTEEYNGSVWTSGGNLSEAKRAGFSSGTQTAALIFSGTGPGVPRTSKAEKYDGTSWSTSPATFPATTVAGGDLSGAGSQTASASFGGSAPGSSVSTIEFDGGAFSTVSIDVD